VCARSLQERCCVMVGGRINPWKKSGGKRAITNGLCEKGPYIQGRGSVLKEGQGEIFVTKGFVRGTLVYAGV